MLGLKGIKEKTGQLYDGNQATHVTYITLNPHHVTQIKMQDKNGYSAVQLTTNQKKAKKAWKVHKAQLGHLKKANVEPGISLWECRVDDDSADLQRNIGDKITVDYFSEVKNVKVSAKSKGKGFAGVIKRHNFSSQDATHGNSLSHRAPGSIGQRNNKSKVDKNKKGPGHMGNERITIRSEIFQVYPEKSLLIVKGPVPGPVGGLVWIKPS